MARISVRFASEDAAAAEAQRQAQARQQVVFLVQTQDDGEAWHWEVHDSSPEGRDALPVAPR